MSDRRGIILAGGSGSRLHPITKGPSKQLLPVYDKPMIYYPLSTLLLAGIREVLVITTPHDAPMFHSLLGDGKDWGIDIRFAVQPKPEGLAQAFHIGEAFLGGRRSSLVLGDNIFYGHDFHQLLLNAKNREEGATIFTYHVNDPERYGVVEFDEHNNALSLEEKPTAPKSNFAVPGLYFYDNQVVEIAKNIPASPRGEYEITDVNKVYLERKQLQVGIMNRGTAWLDTGTFESLADACEFVRVIEKRQSQKIGCIEEVAFRMGFIDKAQLMLLADKYAKSGYGEYLRNLKK